jgi:hypothetical protein
MTYGGGSVTDGRRDDSRREAEAGVRQRTPRALRWLGLFWQNAIPLLALALAFLAIKGTTSKLDRQREGRGVAINVLCGGLRGVEDAGVAILKDQLPNVPHRDQTAQEARLRERFAQSYAAIISKAVLDQAGRTLKDVLEPDGRLNCDRVVKASAAGTQK